jgi:hypothetical protein
LAKIVRVSAVRWLAMVGLCAACGPVARPEVKDARPKEARPEPAAPPPCAVQTRRLSSTGRDAVKPSVAVLGTTARRYGVVWEQSDESHRGIRFQALDDEARPLAPPVEIADLERGGAEPRVTADACADASPGPCDGFAVTWTVDQAETSVIAFRRFDARGRPRGEGVPAVSATGARALAVAPAPCGPPGLACPGGFALVWWTWVGSPPVQRLSWLDGDGHPRGAAVELSRTALVAPAADLRIDAKGAMRAAWQAEVGGVQHVLWGRIARDAAPERVDVGRGDSPSLVGSGIVFAHLDDGSVWYAPFASPAPVRFSDGQAPDAAVMAPGHSVVCVARTVITDDESVDELDCLRLDHGQPVRDDAVAHAPRGLGGLQVAAWEHGYGVAYESKEPDAQAVSLAVAKCP